MDLDFSGRLLFLLKLLLRCVSTQPSPLPSQRAAAEMPFTRPRALLIYPSPHQRGVTTPLITLPGSSPVRKSQVFYLCCVTIQLWNKTTCCQPTRQICSPEKGVQRRKPHLSSIHHGKDCPAFIDNCFFPFKETAFEPSVM